MKNFIQNYSNWIGNNTKLLSTLLVGISLFFCVQLLWLKVNPSLFLLDKSHIGRVQMEKARTHFTGAGEQILVGIVTTKPSIFNVDSLTNVAKLSDTFLRLNLVEESDADRLQALAQDPDSKTIIEKILINGIDVDDKFELAELRKHFAKNYATQESSLAFLQNLELRAAPIVRIRSLSNVENMQLKNEFLDIHDLMMDVPENAPSASILEQEAYENKLFVDSLISADKKSTMIQIELLIDEEDSYNLQKMYAQVLDILENTNTTDSFHIGGTATYMAAITQIVEQDNNKFFPFVIVLIALLLFLSFRGWQGILIPLGIAIVTLIWTMGVVSLLGYKLNIITNMIPVFLISIAVADAIHFLSAYYHQVQEHDQKKAIVKSLDHLFVPMLLTTITTFFGFIAFTTSNLSFLREFGMFVAIGIVFAFILTITILPLILPRLKNPKEKLKENSNKGLIKVVDRLAIKANNLVASNPKSLLLIFVVMLGLFGWQGSNIVVDNENIASFSESTRVRADNDALNAHFGGTIPVSIWFETEQQDIMKTPEMVSLISDIQSGISKHQSIGYTLSYVDYLDRIHDVMADDETDTLPEGASSELISQYLLLYEFGQGTEILDVLDYNYMNARIIALSYTDKGTVWQDIIANIQSLAKDKLPPGVKLHIIGTGELQASNIPEIIRSQVLSLIISVVLITLLMIVLFRSVLLGAIGVLPLLSTITLLAGTMSVFGIPLDIGSSLVCGICFGVGIDYSIHFISVFKRNFAELNGDWDDALLKTMNTVCRPIIINSLTLACGFFVLYLSDYAAIRNLGILVALSMLLSALFSLLIVPLFIRLTKPRQFSSIVASPKEVM